MNARTLEAALEKIMADNDLTSIRVGIMTVGARKVRTANVHYAGHARDGINCSTEHSDHSIQDAIHKALLTAASNRTPAVTMPCTLPTLVTA